MIGVNEWQTALDKTAARLLRQAGVEGPPVDAFVVAERLQLSVFIDEKLQARGCRKQLSESTLIVLGDDQREERFQFALAHEIGEQFAADVLDVVGLELQCAGSRLVEDVANRLAGRLLCPADWFRMRADQCCFDLLALKDAFRTASHELIAYRMLDLEIPTVITVYDKGRVSRRQSNLARRPPIQPIERACQVECHAEAEPKAMRDGRLQVQGWPIHEREWKREILRTTAEDVE